MIAELAGIQAEAAAVQGAESELRLELEFCRELGCLEVEDDGFVAYFRCRPGDIPAVKEGDINSVQSLPRSVLLGGSVMMIVDIMAVKDGFTFRKVRELGRKPGVKSLMGLTGGRWRFQPCRG